MIFKGNKGKGADIVSELGFLGKNKQGQNVPTDSQAEQRSVGDIIADLEASDRLREDRRSGTDRRAAAQAAAAAESAQAASAQKPTPVASTPTVIKNEIDGDLPVFDDAQKRLAAHRAEIQKMLDEARVVEERLVAEASKARQEAGRIQLQEKQTAVAAAIAQENEWATKSTELSKRRDDLAADHARAAASVRAAQDGMAAAQATLADVTLRLKSAQQAAEEAQKLAKEREVAAANVLLLLETAQREAAEADKRAAASFASRVKAEQQLREAEEKAHIFTPSSETLESIRAIETRVQQKSAS